MAQPYVGEIRMFGGTFAPRGWMFCEGQLLPISENETLFQLIGTTYGGDGQTTFALPDLRGRIPVHQGNGFIAGEAGGQETVALTVAQMPSHGHPFRGASTAGNEVSPANNVPADSFNVTPYINAAPDGNMSPSAITTTGGSRPHPNVQPYLCVNFIISLFGIFPSQS
jgi:microcystin-dependent protein